MDARDVRVRVAGSPGGTGPRRSAKLSEAEERARQAQIQKQVRVRAGVWARSTRCWHTDAARRVSPRPPAREQMSGSLRARVARRRRRRWWQQPDGSCGARGARVGGSSNNSNNYNNNSNNYNKRIAGPA
jgi:hypothetical protein